MADNPHQPYECYVEDILGVLSLRPERPALITEEGRTVLAGEVRDSVHQMAAELAERGIGRGSTVSFLTGNQPEALVARYAANLLGARVVFLNEGMSPGGQAEVVNSVGTAMLLVAPTARTAAEALLAEARVPAVFTLGPASFGVDLSAHAAARAPHPVVGAALAGDDWCIRYTGGTTGIPKGIRMAHGPYRQMLTQRARSVPSGARPRFLACTPLAHMAGILADVALLAGGTVVLRHAFDPHDVLATVQQERITDMWLLPPLLYTLLDHPELATTEVSSLQRIIYGGTAVSAQRMRQAADAFGPVLYGSYGQTEAGSITEVLPQEHAMTGRSGQATAGRACPGVDIEIRDEGGAVLAPGDTGEIHVRTPMMMSGYWRQPELTAEVLRDGWVRTGDLGYLDAEGYLYLVDRLKDVVVVVGGHVYPTELEQLLLTHPAVAQCTAFGVRRADQSEEVHVAIVPAAGRGAGRELVREFVRERMGTMYVPSAVHIVDRIPLTAAGKPDKKLLRATLGTK
ncbi:AMP-binding protein [Streptomyces netropsis]|uniref:Fatty-acyl-CoA synthase n=1 Tax=Streptomyces netropsis TaxID=55404 RepID=A0A7W7LDE2_STRNE|nr:AMP-binding protein [Streptomyces netropsis]MBB4887999.1 fatty-acyl-CoA synthase [Streptomyces netropsis]GGR32798.1 fatty acid CoA ligase [Streptomyces netropsis]